jgi:hypothetical protein
MGSIEWVLDGLYIFKLVILECAHDGGQEGVMNQMQVAF